MAASHAHFLLLLLVPIALAQTQSQDCAPFEALYDQSGRTYKWTKGACCNLTAGFPNVQPSFNCTAAGRVTGGRVEWGVGLKGPIPDFSGVTEIELLDLGVSALTGRIPSWLSSLTKLRILNLGTSTLSGTIPDLRKLTNLEELYLDSNQFTGPIPASILGLARLRVLSLHDNQLSGKVDDLLPPSITNCNIGNNTNLYTCGGFVPSACGTIQTNMTSCKLIQALDCAPFESMYAQAGRTLPWTRGSCCDLTKGFPGSGPSFNCSGARVVGAKFQWGDNIGGQIADLSPLTELQFLDLGLNQFTGPIPALDALTKLRSMNLGTNNLTGSIPPSVVALASIERLFLDRNNLNGPVPSLVNLTKLNTLSIGRNDFSGNFDNVIPSGVTDCDISSNPGLYTCGGTILAACGRLPQNTSACASASSVAASSSTTGQTRPTANNPQPPPAASDSPPSSVGPIAGGVVGGVMALLALAGVFFWVSRKRRNSYATSKRGAPPTASAGTGPRMSTSRPLLPETVNGSSRDLNDATTSSSGYSSWSENGLQPPPISAIPLAPSIASPNASTSGLPPRSISSQNAIFSPHNTNSVMTIAYRSMNMADIPSGGVPKGAYDGLPSRAVELPESTVASGSSNGGSRSLQVENLPPSKPHWAFAFLAGPSFESLPALNLPQRMPVLTVETDYIPINPDEVAVTLGETFKLRTIFCDGWGYGTNVDSDETGMVPLDCLRIASSQPLFTGQYSSRLQSRHLPSLSFGTLPTAGDGDEYAANRSAGRTLVDVRGAPSTTGW